MSKTILLVITMLLLSQNVVSQLCVTTDNINWTPVDSNVCNRCDGFGNCIECTQVGFKPNLAQTDCFQCLGTVCLACSANNICESNSCSLGQKPNSDYTNCVQCLPEYCDTCEVDFPNICSSYNDAACNAINSGYISSADGTNCVDCSHSSNCDRCWLDNKCIVCNVDYSLKEDYTCISCNIPGCITCSAPDICVQCEGGPTQRPSLDGGSCNLCLQGNKGCTNCGSNNLCQACNSLPDAILTLSQQKTCQSCNINHCSLCNQREKCSSCQQIDSVVAKTNIDMNKCFKCSDDKCQYCSGDEFCQRCIGYNDRVPVYPNSDGVCTLCVEDCLACQVEGVCLTCIDGKKPSQDGLSCFTCPAACDFCNSDNECKCQTGKLTNIDGNACFYCNHNFCQHCSADGVCQQCNDPAKKPSQDGLNCFTCPAGCDFCNGDNFCGCLNGKLPNAAGDSCFTCDSSFCLHCSDDNVCSDCLNSGQKPNKQGSQCFDCFDGCKYCVENDSCQQCSIQGQLPDDDNQDGLYEQCDVPCLALQNCDSCSNGVSCDTCEKDYVLNGFSHTCFYIAPTDVINNCQIYWPFGPICAICGGNQKPNGLRDECVDCNINHCSQCNNAGKCIQCRLGYKSDGNGGCQSRFNPHPK